MATNIDGITAGGSFVSLMKRLQPQKRIEALWQTRYPFLAMVKKSDRFVGSQIDVPLEYDHPAASRTFTATSTGALAGDYGAQGGRYPSSSVKYSLTRVKDYGIGQLDAETMRASRNDQGSWVRAVDREMSNTLKSLQKRTAIALYRNHGGAIGVISAIANGDGTNDRLTLTVKSDVWNFSRGQSIVLSAADGTSGAVRDGSDYVIVRKIDFVNGYVYVGSAVGTAADITSVITGATAGDYIFNAGDFGGSFRGLESWVPLTAPSSGESFLGIDRSPEPERLAGHRLNDTSLSLEETIQELAARISYTGGSPNKCFMAPIQVKQLALELDTKVVRDPGGTGKVGFSGVMVSTAAGDVEVLGDPACPELRMFLVDMDSFELIHLDPLPHLVEDDGLTMARVSNADRVEFRYRLWGNLACHAPGHNGVAALAAAI